LPQEREHLLPDRREHHGWLVVLEPRPSELLLVGAESEVTWPAEATFALGERLQVIQPPDEQQLGDLLDHLQRV
ncbi:MAG: hypothetical protein ACSLE6_10995, partial [Mycobacterium sp.]